jgi:hypothetical protein
MNQVIKKTCFLGITIAFTKSNTMTHSLFNPFQKFQFISSCETFQEEAPAEEEKAAVAAELEEVIFIHWQMHS